MWIAQLSVALRNREYSEVGGIAIGDFMPVQWRGHTSIGKRTDGICRTRRAVLCVLVVIKKHTVTLLFPPLRSRKGRHASLDGARQRECGPPYLNERPALLNTDVHMHSA